MFRLDQLDLGDYHRRFPEVLEKRYGDSFEKGFREIKSKYKEVRDRPGGIDIDDVMAIFGADLPFVHDWAKPDYKDLADRMAGTATSPKVATLISRLRDQHYEPDLIKDIWKCFRELSLTALVLHHVYPSKYAMCSHHLASLLHITGPTVPEFYVNYCRELEFWSKHEWRPTRCKLSVADTEFALWTWYRLAHYGKKQEKKRHLANFREDEFVQGRRAEQIGKSLGTLGKLDLARHYLHVDPTVAAMIAWRELECAVRRVLSKAGIEHSEKTCFKQLVNALPINDRSKSDLMGHWRRRNDVIHRSQEVAEDKEANRAAAQTLLRGVMEFIERNK